MYIYFKYGHTHTWKNHKIAKNWQCHPKWMDKLLFHTRHAITYNTGIEKSNYHRTGAGNWIIINGNNNVTSPLVRPNRGTSKETAAIRNAQDEMIELATANSKIFHNCADSRIWTAALLPCHLATLPLCHLAYLA